MCFFYCTEIDTGKIKVLMDENQKKKKILISNWQYLTD